MDDCLILGGGVIGLSLAYELAGHGLRVRVIDRTAPGSEASWAGAGIIPPGSNHEPKRLPPYDALVAISSKLHSAWSAQLREQTGIDNGYRVCGGLYLARNEQGRETLDAAAQCWQAGGIDARPLSIDELAQREPALTDDDVRPPVTAACLLPGEAQIRNPRHLKALFAACTSRGVTVSAAVEAYDFESSRGRVSGVVTSQGMLGAGAVCVATGAWSRLLLDRLGVRSMLKPIRGQIVLLAARPGQLRHVVNEGARYLVPRPDGRVLVGSTEEDVGFEKRTTGAGVASLLQFALGLAPSLADAAIERCWAGLRPATQDGLPYLGRAPDLENVFVAAGHFRGGLHLSTGTAVVMSELVRGQAPQIDLAPFRLDRT